jgi:hypothetical protein
VLSTIRRDLPLIAFLCSSIECNFAELDFTDVAETALDVLASPGEVSAKEIDSSFEILGMTTSSFSVSISAVDDGTLELQFKNRRTGKERYIALKIQKYSSRSSLFLLPLPIDLLQTSEADGVLQVNAKFQTLARIAGNTATDLATLSRILGMFAEFLIRPYNEMTSACVVGLSLCLNAFLRGYHQGPPVTLVERVVFAKPHSWYHSATILRLIKGIPFPLVESLFNGRKLAKVLLGICMSQNEKLQANAKKYLAKFVCGTGFFKYTSFIASQVEFFDYNSLTQYIDILRIILASTIDQRFRHLEYVAHTLCQGYKMYKHEGQLAVKILGFLSRFQLAFLPPELLLGWFGFAIAIIFASISKLTGRVWKTTLKDTAVQRAITLVENDMNLMDYDIISDSAMNYSSFLGPFASALAFVTAVPPDLVELDTVKSLFPRVLNLFPYEAARLIFGHWTRFDEDQKQRFMEIVFPTLPYVQDYRPAAVWCSLFMSVPGSDTNESLRACREMLKRIASWAVDKREFFPPFFAFLHYLGQDIEADMRRLNADEANQVDKLIKGTVRHMPPLSRFGSSTVIRIESESSFLFDPIDRGELGKSLMSTFDPLIKTQLQYVLYEFSQGDLLLLLGRYCEVGDGQGVVRVLQYARSRGMLLSLKGFYIPIEAMAKALFYLHQFNSPELDYWYAMMSPFQGDPDLDFAIHATSLAKFLTGTTPLTKRQLIALCQVWGRIQKSNFDSQSLISFVTDLFSASRKKPKRLALVTLLAALISNTIPSIPSSFVATLMLRFHLDGESIPVCCIVQCLVAISRRLPRSQPNQSLSDCIQHLCERTDPHSPECVSGTILLLQWFVNPTIDPKLIADLVSYQVPSFFSIALRLFSQLLQAKDQYPIQHFIKPNLTLFFTEYPNYVALASPSEAITYPIASMLSQQTFHSCHHRIVKSLPLIMTPHDRASFSSICICIFRAIRVADPADSEPVRFLCELSDSLVTEPASFALMQQFMASLNERGRKASSPDRKEAFFMDQVALWLKRCAATDCYRMADIVFEWLKLIYENIGLEQMLSIVCLQFHKYCPRFFPLFVGLAKYFRIHLRSPQKRGLISEALQRSALVNTCRAHALATLLLDKREHRKLACDLAAFSGDCAESELIIESHPELKEILERAQHPVD